MECNHARLLLTFARDHADLDQSEADGLELHLSACPECAAWAATEQRVDAVLGKAMNAVPVPAGLKQRILAKLPLRRMSWRRLIVTTAAAAAVLLLAIGFTWRVWLAPRPDPEFNDVPIVLVVANQPRSPEEVQDWFRDKKLPMAFPAEFSARKLNAYYVGYFQGRRVPKLVFFDRASGHVAHIYVLSDKQFNIDAELPSHLRTLRSMETFKQDGYLYLAVYTGSLDPFRN